MDKKAIATLIIAILAVVLFVAVGFRIATEIPKILKDKNKGEMMDAVKLLNATRTLAQGQDEYNDLDILDADVDGSNCMFSVWEPTAGELEALNNGGKIQLGVMGGIHPPIMLIVQDPNAKIVGDKEPPEEDQSGIIV